MTRTKMKQWRKKNIQNNHKQMNYYLATAHGGKKIEHRDHIHPATVKLDFSLAHNSCVTIQLSIIMCAFLPAKWSTPMSNTRILYIIFTICSLCFFALSFQYHLLTKFTIIQCTDNANSLADYVSRIVYYAVMLPSILGIFMSICAQLTSNPFECHIQLKAPISKAPFLCFRTVTRGNYPQLIKDNIQRNKHLCQEVGLKKFVIQVVTDIEIPNFPLDPFLTQTVVPKTYSTSKGNLYKGRALQYVLEDHVNILHDNDWIVHLDEETLLTTSSLHGILNFATADQHPIGQGAITYANDVVVTWWTTIMDYGRVGDDLSKLRFQLHHVHRVLFDFKGSFLVCKAKVERDVSFDQEPSASLSEDIYFGFMAGKMGYSFDFIEGVMWEKSPFTLRDFITQRKRWISGQQLMLMERKVPLTYKINLGLFLAGTFFPYFAACNSYFPLPCHMIKTYSSILNFIFANSIQVYLLGCIKSYLVYPHRGIKHLFIGIVLVLPVIMFSTLLYMGLTVYVLLVKDKKFNVVTKSYENKHSQPSKYKTNGTIGHDMSRNFSQNP